MREASSSTRSRCRSGGKREEIRESRSIRGARNAFDALRLRGRDREVGRRSEGERERGSMGSSRRDQVGMEDGGAALSVWCADSMLSILDYILVLSVRDVFNIHLTVKFLKFYKSYLFVFKIHLTVRFFL